MSNLRLASVLGVMFSPVAVAAGFGWWQLTPYCFSAEYISGCSVPAIVYIGEFVFILSAGAFVASLAGLLYSFIHHV